MKKKLVNWTKAMYMNPLQFIQQEDYFIEQISDGLGISVRYNKYGLLPMSGEESPNEIVIQEKASGSVEIRLNSCNAITSGGFQIHYPFENTDYLIKSYTFGNDMTSNGDTWNIILAINPYIRIVSGIPDTDEDPPRHPDALPTLNLFVLPSIQTNENKMNPQHLIIGKIKKNGERYEIDSNYIPPCTCMTAHPQLLKYYNQFTLLMSTLEKSSKDIIQKIRDKEKTSSLAVNIEKLCQELMRYISSVYFSFRNSGAYWSPYETANCFSSLAHSFHISLSFMSVQEREELFNYFFEWQMIVPGAFEISLSEVIELRYDHNDIFLVMEKLKVFTTALTGIWLKLSELEYIGLHKRSIIVSEGTLGEDNTSESIWKKILG